MRKFTKKHAKLVAAVTLAAGMIATSSVFALNTPGTSQGAGDGNKPFSFVGYQYLDNGASADTLQLNFNKNLASPAEVLTSADWQKVVTVTGGTTNPTVSSVSINAGSGYDDGNQYSSGTRVVFTFSGDLDPDTLYTVTIKNLVINTNGISLGNYMDRENLTFKFRTPDGLGGYADNNPYVTYVVGDPTDHSGTPDTYQNVSWESDLTVIFDRPMYSSQVSTYETGLNGGYEKNSGTWNDVSLGTTSGSYEGYPARHNDALTTFFFPMTNSSFSTACYNRSQSANSYRLTLPTDFYDNYNNHTTAYDGMGGTFYFNTVANDYPGWLNNTTSLGGDNTPLSVTLNGTTLTVGWHQTCITPLPDKYKVYYIDSVNGDQFSDVGSWTYAGYIDASSYSAFDSISYDITSLTSGHTYYVRVVPQKAYGGTDYLVGYSISGHN